MYSIIAYPPDPILGAHAPRYDIVLTVNINVPHKISGVVAVPLFPPFKSREDAECALSNVYLHPYDPVNPVSGP